MGILDRIRENIRDIRLIRSEWDALRRLLEDRPYLREVAAEQEFVKQTLSERAFLAEALRLKDYTRSTQEERFWLEEALANKTLMMRTLDAERGRKTARQRFEDSLAEFRTLAGVKPRLPARDLDLNPQLADATSDTPFDRHYLYHPAWALRVLASTTPDEHVDIGSILQFSTMLSAFIPTRFYDVRPARVQLEGLTCGTADLTALPFADDSIGSLSCLHTIEHVGLGRYGDPLDPEGDIKAARELVRVLKPGGDLLVATPVGTPRIAFNAHRIYDSDAFAGYFQPLELVQFALIEEHGEGGLIVNPPVELVRAQSYGCGCFWLRKPRSR
jgi:hypothetical protein